LLAINQAHHRENPDFQIQASLEELLRVPWLRLCISTIFVDTVNDIFCFALCQELVGFVRFVWKSTNSQYAATPRKQVKAPSMMKILDAVSTPRDAESMNNSLPAPP
jgi:hypothetical protein